MSVLPPSNPSQTASRKTTVLSFAGALLVVLFISLGLILLTNLHDDVEGSTKTYELALEEIPPYLPPPPEEPVPIRISDTRNIVIDMIGPASGPKVEFKSIPKIAIQQETKVAQPDVDIDFSKSFAQLTGVDELFDVQNLDEKPRIIQSSFTSIPRSLRRKGVTRVETRVQIVIDETGKVHIRSIVDPKYEIMRPIIRKHIDGIRFSIPTKYGKPVSASYLFYLNFNDHAIGK